MTASWTQPRTWSVGELTTAAFMNQHLRDNLDWLRTPPAAIDTASGISTTSASPVDVTGSSISVTTTGTGGVDIFWVGVYSVSATASMTVALVADGSTVFTMPLSTSLLNYGHNCSFAYHIAAPSAGSHTYKIQVSTNAGTMSTTGYMMYGIERGS